MKKFILFPILFLSFLLLIPFSSSEIQLSFILDLDRPLFNFTQTEIVNGSLPLEIEFEGKGDKIIYIKIPNTSIILFSNLTIQGGMRPVGVATLEQIYDVAVADVNESNPFDEIAIGTSGDAYVELLSSDGEVLWKYPMSSYVYSVSIGNLSSDKGLEIAAGDSSKFCVFNSSGSQLGCAEIGSSINDIEVSDVLEEEFDEIAVASDTGVFLYLSNFTKVWGSSLSACRGVSIGNLSSNKGLEIAASCGTILYIFNSSGNVTLSKDLGISINDVEVAEINSSYEYDEIIVALNNGTLLLLDHQANKIWSFDASDSIDCVKAYEVTTEYQGYEVVFGSYDDYLYVLSPTGKLIWKYQTENDVRGVGVGNLTLDPGSEVVGGTNIPAENTLYILNFEYYPTNVTVDIGNDGKVEAFFEGKFRSTRSISNNSAFQSYLDSCFQSYCEVPVKFHSDYAGILNLLNINITYSYNLSTIINYTIKQEWAKTSNIWVNQSVGSEVRKINYTGNPVFDVKVNYIKLPQDATQCIFNEMEFEVREVNGIKVCDISGLDYTMNSSGSLQPAKIWDDTLATSIPVYMNSSPPIIESGFWKKNLTIWNETTTIFYNVTANATINESIIIADSRLKVFWNGNWYDLINSTFPPESDCKNNPVFYEISIEGDLFYVCKQDTDGNGVADYFVWKQPHTSITLYELSGSANHPAKLEELIVEPEEDYWGRSFNVSVNFTDEDGDNITVRLYAFINKLEKWEFLGEENITSGEFANFTIETNKSWTGVNKIKFEYNDYNISEGYYHDWRYEEFLAPNVTKHPLLITLVSGNDTDVNRTDSVTFAVGVNDSLLNQSVENITCNFFVTTNDSAWKLIGNSLSNQSGICSFEFSPTSDFLPGERWWKVEVFNETYYSNASTQNFTVRIYGKMYINFTKSTYSSNLTRGVVNRIGVNIKDEFGQVIKLTGECVCKLSIYNSSLTEVFYDYENVQNGVAYFNWEPPCNYSLGSYIIKARILEGSCHHDFYYIVEGSKNITRYLKDNLTILINSPKSGLEFLYGDYVYLNATVRERCGLKEPQHPYSVIWNGTWEDPQIALTFFSEALEWYAEGNGINKKLDSAPGKLIIKVKSIGDLYNPSENETWIWVRGLHFIEIKEPSSDTIQRSEGACNLTIKCYTYFPNATNMKEVSYAPVWIWIFNEEEGIEKLLYNSVTEKGFLNYTIDIGNSTEFPPGPYLIKCNTTNFTQTEVSEKYPSLVIPPSDSYRFYAAKKEDVKEIYILDVDFNPPTIHWLIANSTEPGGFVTIKANISDWYGVDKVWVNLTYPNGTSSLLFLTNTTPDKRKTIWILNLTQLTQEGDYDFVLFANDTSNNLAFLKSWFSVFKRMNLYVKSENKFWFEFYRPSKNILVHRIAVEPNKFLNASIFQRTYDLRVLINDEKLQTHWVEFKELNTTKTSEKQFGEVSNITNPINISTIPLTYLDPPIPSRNHEIGALKVETIFAYKNAFIVFNYSETPIDFESSQSIVAMKCSDWRNNACYSNWTLVNGSWVNRTLHLLYVPASSFSVYYAFEREICGNGLCGEGESPLNCPEDCGPPPPETAGASVGEGAGLGVKPVCGNGICEEGENETTCPIDCAPIRFTAKTNLTQAELLAGESKSYALWITNLLNASINVSISIEGSAATYVKVETEKVSLAPYEEKVIGLTIRLPPTIPVGTYLGEIILRSGHQEERLPFKLFVSLREEVEFGVVVETLTREVRPNQTARFQITIYNLGIKRRYNLTLKYALVNLDTKKVIYSESETIFMETSKSFVKEIKIPKNATLGVYSFMVEAIYKKKRAVSSDTLRIVKPLLEQVPFKLLLIFAGLGVSLIAWYYVRKRYIKWKKEKARYIFPVDFRKLPRGELWLGKIAETNVRATFSMSDLTTHVLIAGATGSGKSVTASLFVEELLDKKIPVVVFDPTAQWTGFVRACRDKKVLRYYKKFGLNPRIHPRSYKGMIIEVTRPDIKIDFKKLMNPGEITVFTLNKLKPGEYDDAVRNIIDTIFRQGWEESTELKLVIVFDEVHRLLEKYGGKGGYVALEKACREFRKWGIGLIMISQVLSDFKEAIRGNVLTEIQMHTKSIEDLSRIETKYGLEYAKRVAREEVGVGMVQNPRYNDGRPWFVSFRPPYHNPHKLLEKELKMYTEFAKMIELIESEIEKLEKAGKDVFGMKIELKLAKDKLKQGRFRMAEIYINSLKKALGLEYGKVGGA